jgi:hypothetical protein
MSGEGVEKGKNGTMRIHLSLVSPLKRKNAKKRKEDPLFAW